MNTTTVPGLRPGLTAAGGDVLDQLAEAVLPVVSGRSTAEGDLFIQHWPRHKATTERSAAVKATRPLPRAGADLLGDGSHVLLADGPRVTWGGQPSASGLTLGTLVVGAGSVAVLSHREHRDLRIGCGIYVIRRSRWVTLLTTSRPALPQAEPDWREAID
ncbi:MAG TPA: hypothetical protein VFP72_19230 [Kineosporiaceae bacterium]|nr:hypothetical protein [Kineosporiaceae bacterium]